MLITPVHLRRRSTERGFTLVEMIISLVVMGVLIGAVFPLVSEITRTGGRDSARHAARGDARTHAQLLEADLRAMRAPLRPTGDGVDAVNIIAALNGGTATMPLPSATWPTIPTPTLWGQPTTRDLLFAGPSGIMFWADVMENPAGAFETELVRWYVLSGTQARNGCPTGRSWCLIREVKYATNANASGAAAMREVLSSGVGAIPPSRACYPGATAGTQERLRVFCFQSQVPALTGTEANRYRWAQWSRTCQSVWDTPTQNPNDLAGPARAFRMSAITGMTTRPGISSADAVIRVDHEENGPLHNIAIHPLDRITAIGAMLPGGGVANGTSDVAIANAETAIPSRSSSEYRNAIMCGDR